MDPVDEEAFTADLEALTNVKTYIHNICNVIFGSGGGNSLLESLENDENVKALTSFVSNPDTMSLFVSKGAIGEKPGN